MHDTTTALSVELPCMMQLSMQHCCVTCDCCALAVSHSASFTPWCVHHSMLCRLLCHQLLRCAVSCCVRLSRLCYPRLSRLCCPRCAVLSTLRCAVLCCAVHAVLSMLSIVLCCAVLCCAVLCCMLAYHCPACLVAQTCACIECRLAGKASTLSGKGGKR